MIVKFKYPLDEIDDCLGFILYDRDNDMFVERIFDFSQSAERYLEELFEDGTIEREEIGDYVLCPIIDSDSFAFEVLS